jgi:hypothetical protein
MENHEKKEHSLERLRKCIVYQQSADVVRGFSSHEIPSLLQLNPGECEQQFSGHFRRKRRQQLRRLGHGRRESNNVKQSQPDCYSPISSQRSRLERLHVGTKLWIHILESILACSCWILGRAFARQFD